MSTDKATIARGLLEGELIEKILSAAFKVHNALGCGFLEKVYENALLVQLTRMGLTVTKQQPYKVQYEGAIVGDYFADLVVEKRVIVECKALAALDGIHESNS